MIAPALPLDRGHLGRVEPPWNAVENTTRHISELSSYLIRLYTQAKAANR